jgi:hypothetical protein
MLFNYFFKINIRYHKNILLFFIMIITKINIFIIIHLMAMILHEHGDFFLYFEKNMNF